MIKTERSMSAHKINYRSFTIQRALTERSQDQLALTRALTERSQDQLALTRALTERSQDQLALTERSQDQLGERSVDLVSAQPLTRALSERSLSAHKINYRAVSAQ